VLEIYCFWSSSKKVLKQGTFSRTRKKAFVMFLKEYRGTKSEPEVLISLSIIYLIREAFKRELVTSKQPVT
jgi:hypothetical protein